MNPQGFALGLMLIYIILIGLGVYSMVLFIKLAHRGIKALDIYISNNQKDTQI